MTKNKNEANRREKPPELTHTSSKSDLDLRVGQDANLTTHDQNGTFVDPLKLWIPSIENIKNESMISSGNLLDGTDMHPPHSDVDSDPLLHNFNYNHSQMIISTESNNQRKKNQLEKEAKKGLSKEARKKALKKATSLEDEVDHHSILHTVYPSIGDDIMVHDSMYGELNGSTLSEMRSVALSPPMLSSTGLQQDSKSLAKKTFSNLYTPHSESISNDHLAYLYDLSVNVDDNEKVQEVNSVYLSPTKKQPKQIDNENSTTSGLITFPFKSFSSGKNPDIVFGRFYLANLLALLMIGLGNLLLNGANVNLRTSYYFNLLLRSSPIFFIFLFVTMILGIGFTYLLHSYAALFVWTCIGLIPTISGIVFLLSIIEVLVGNAITNPTVLILTCLGSLLFTYLFLRYLKTLQQRINVSIQITQSTSKIVQMFPELFPICYGILICYLVFVGIWFLLYAHLFLIEGGVSGGPQLQLLPGSIVLQIYFLLFFIWTTLLIGNIQKSIIGRIVGHYWWWNQGLDLNTGYQAFNRSGFDKSFFKEDPDFMGSIIGEGSYGAIDDNLGLSLTPSRPYFNQRQVIIIESIDVALRYSFGTLCIASLLLGLSKMVRLLLRLLYHVKEMILRHTFADRGLVILLKPLESTLALMDHIFARFTSYSVIYASFSGTTFFTAGRQLVSLLGDYLDLFITGDILVQWILTISAILMSALLLLIVYLFDLPSGIKTDPASASSSLPILLFGLVAYGLLRFTTSIITDVLDAAFLCHILDTESDRQDTRETILSVKKAFSDMLNQNEQYRQRQQQQQQRTNHLEDQHEIHYSHPDINV